MICPAHFPKDREEIINLWSSCFGDERHYIEFFLNNLPSENVPFVYKINKVMAGMMILMPARLSFKDKNELIYYVFAVGVSKGFRNRGIAGEMLQFAKEYAAKNNAELCLVPADKELLRYYEKRGFSVAFNKQSGFEKSAMKSDAVNSMTRIEALHNIHLLDNYVEVLYNKREEAVRSVGAFLWGKDNFLFALKEHIYTGGFIYITSVANVGYEAMDLDYIIGMQSPEGIFVREALIGDRLTGNTSFCAMITTMSYGAEFLKDDTTKYINFCFN